MECKRAKVIMLPTNEKAKIGEITTNTSMDNSLFIMDSDVYYAWSNIGSGHHLRGNNLYFTTDDEIKDADYCIITNKVGTQFLTIFKDNKYWFVSNNSTYTDVLSGDAFKIVATTDPSLTVHYKGHEYGTAREYEAEVYLPQPSQAFIEKYCKLGGIDEVLIEMNVSMLGNHQSKTEYSGIKVDSHNEITIHPIKDSWNRKEVEEICSLYESIIHEDFHMMNEEDMIKRIEEIKQ